MPEAFISRDLGSKPCLGHNEARLEISQAKFNSCFPEILAASFLLFVKCITSALRSTLLVCIFIKQPLHIGIIGHPFHRRPRTQSAGCKSCLMHICNRNWMNSATGALPTIFFNPLPNMILITFLQISEGGINVRIISIKKGCDLTPQIYTQNILIAQVYPENNE